MLEQDIKKVLVSHDEIVAAAKNLGTQLTSDYAVDAAWAARRDGARCSTREK